MFLSSIPLLWTIHRRTVILFSLHHPRQLDALMDLLPGVNITNVFANAPGVLIRSVNSLPAKVKKLELLFPSANVTRMVSRTPGILYLDIDRNIKPKALWIKEVVGLDQDGLDALVETGEQLTDTARLKARAATGILRCYRQPQTRSCWTLF